LTIENASELDIQGLAMVGQKVFIRSDCTDIEITGALFVVGQIAETARDDSGQGNDAVVCGQTTWRPLAGSAGGAMEFSGIDGYLRTADSATQLQMANDYTLCTWIKPASTQNDFAGIISRCNAAGTENHWTLQFDRYGDALRICHYSSIWNIGLTCDQVADGSWHHLAIVREGNQMRTYLDSVLVSTGTFDTAPGSGDGHLNIGADMTGSPSYVYTGLLDDVRIYDAALSQANITDIHAQLPVAITPIGHWKLDGADSVVTVTAEPALASVILPVEVPGMSHITDEHWSPAAGAFFRNIQRE